MGDELRGFERMAFELLTLENIALSPRMLERNWDVDRCRAAETFESLEEKGVAESDEDKEMYRIVRCAPTQKRSVSVD